MNEVPMRIAALGYLYALKRFDDTTGRGFIAPVLREHIFIPLLEALTWLDMLLVRPEFEGSIDPELVRAFAFARGRSHHAWAQAIEWRTDVVMPLSPGRYSSGIFKVAPAVVADWCWRSPEKLPGGKRPGHTVGKDEYRRHLAGQRTRSTLDDITTVVANVDFIGESATGT
jgi:hypothetical protein